VAFFGRHQLTSKVKVDNYEQQHISFFVLMPDTLFKMLWNILIIIMLAYTATIAPFRIAFYEDTGTFWSKFYNIFDTFVDIVFGMDIIVNFLSAYEKNNGKFEYSLKRISINYLTGFFLIDFVATIPIQLVMDPKNAFKTSTG